MKLYHGSNVDIKEIDLSKSKVGKDFGCGFYLSMNREQAKEMALRKTEQTGCGKPTINTYDLDESILNDKEVKVLRFEEYSKEWAEFVLMNRQNKGKQSAHDYDIVIGPIANDSVGYQIRRFTSGIIDMERFLQELKYMKGITIQYFFGTEKSIKFLKKTQAK